MKTPLRIGRQQLQNPVILAPMTGVSDSAIPAVGARPWGRHGGVGNGRQRRAGSRAPGRSFGAPRGWAFLHSLYNSLAAMPHWMAEGARIAEAKGADIIDINMGCPAREVTGKALGLGAHARPRPRPEAHRSRSGCRFCSGHAQDAARLG